MEELWKRTCEEIQERIMEDLAYEDECSKYYQEIAEEHKKKMRAYELSGFSMREIEEELQKSNPGETRRFTDEQLYSLFTTEEVEAAIKKLQAKKYTQNIETLSFDL